MISFILRSCLAALFYFSASTVWAQPLPDTGQTACFDNIREITCPQPGQPFYGQDAQYPVHPRSYAKLGHNGVELPNDAAHVDHGGPWLLTRDNFTGLIWETKTSANRSIAYAWSEARDALAAQANSAGYGGYTDWRLPTIRELASLVHRGHTSASMETFWFPNARNTAYWSETGDQENQGNAWKVDHALGGFAYATPKDWRRHARLVRGPATARTTLIDNGDGTMTDVLTGLTWQKASAPGTYSWQAALEYAEGLTLGGHVDWRLPSVNELLTLVDHSAVAPSVFAELVEGTAAAPYWSSTSNVNHPSMAWPVDFRHGGIGPGPKYLPLNVRAVRTGEAASRWDTEIGIINLGSTAIANGILRGFDGTGREVWSRPATLPAHGRLELNIADAAGTVAPQIKSMRLDVADGNQPIAGFLKFYQAGRYRVGLEALPRANQGALYLPHIHSDSQWWTGVGLVNASSATKNLIFTFSDGVTESRSLGANNHDSFTVEQLRGNVPFIGSAQVSNGEGVVGLMLFGSSRTLSGVSLSDATTTTLVFPHVDQNGWWTGVGIYNPNAVPTELTIIGYDEHGQQTVFATETLAAFDNNVFPTTFSPSTAWLTVQSTQPVTGFELFGTEDGNQLGGYSVVNLATTNGVFPKLERNGWTGIAFVNTADTSATITLEARNDNGGIVASRTLGLDAKAKEVDLAENFFPGQDISTATYVRFSSDQQIVGFQLNGSEDGTMLDAIPALGTTHSGSQRLFFPHIDVSDRE